VLQYVLSVAPGVSKGKNK